MEYDGPLGAIWGLPALAVILGVLFGLVMLALLVVIVAHLAFTKFVGATIDALRVRHRKTPGKPPM